MTEKNNTRPSDLPGDYEELSMIIDGVSVKGWSRISETILPDGSKKLVIDGFIPKD